VDQLGVGLIGCGGMGRGLGKQLLTVEGARLVGLADVSSEAVAAAGAELGAPGYPSAEALLERADLDAVVIASPGFLHRGQTELAAALGKHVFVEKPMATNTADCDAMTEAASRAGVTLMVGQVLRYYPCWGQVLEMVRSGRIGDPWAASVTRIGSGWGGWAQPWRNSLEMSGGLLMEVNSHEIDFLCQIGGEVERVYAEGEHLGEDPSDYPNLCFVSLRFKNGAMGLLHTSTVSTIPEVSGRVQGSTGTIVYRDGFSQEGEIRVAPRDGEPETIRVGDIQGENPVRRELRLFVEAARAGGAPPITAAEGRRNVAVAEAAYRSVCAGAPVTL
jgi:predicted dehydrogenase